MYELEKTVIDSERLMKEKEEEVAGLQQRCLYLQSSVEQLQARLEKDPAAPKTASGLAQMVKLKSKIHHKKSKLQDADWLASMSSPSSPTIVRTVLSPENPADVSEAIVVKKQELDVAHDKLVKQLSSISALNDSKTALLQEEIEELRRKLDAATKESRMSRNSLDSLQQDLEDRDSQLAKLKESQQLLVQKQETLKEEKEALEQESHASLKSRQDPGESESADHMQERILEKIKSQHNHHTKQHENLEKLKVHYGSSHSKVTLLFLFERVFLTAKKRVFLSLF